MNQDLTSSQGQRSKKPSKGFIITLIIILIVALVGYFFVFSNGLWKIREAKRYIIEKVSNSNKHELTLVGQVKYTTKPAYVSLFECSYPWKEFVLKQQEKDTIYVVCYGTKAPENLDMKIHAVIDNDLGASSSRCSWPYMGGSGCFKDRPTAKIIYIDILNYDLL